MQIQLTPFPIYREQIYNILPTLVIEKSVFSTGLFIFEYCVGSAIYQTKDSFLILNG